MTFSVTGSGNKSWLDKNFRKMPIAMYKNFVSDTDSSLFPIQDKRTSTPALSSTDEEEYLDFENTDLDLSGVISMTEEAQTINKTNQISIIMEAGFRIDNTSE